jgi:hypothetical protein
VTDLDDRLRTGVTVLAERIEPTTNPNEVISTLGRGPKRSPKIGLRVAVAAAVVLVIVAAVALVRRSEDQPAVDVGPPPTTADAPAWQPRSLGPGWHDLATPPEFAFMNDPELVWTGSSLVAWGGQDVVGRSTFGGVSYDPRTDTWTRLPDYPIVAGERRGAAWTGDELLVWTATGVVSWTPGSPEWRVRAWPPPVYPRNDGVWTGDEVLYWQDGVAYEAATDAWRVIDRVPIELEQPRAVWADDELVVLGMNVDGPGLPFTTTLAFDPETNQWRELSSPPDIQVTTASLAADAPMVVAADYLGHVFRFDLATDEWTPLLDLPIPVSEAFPTPFLVDGSVYVQHGGDGAVMDESGTWVVDEPSRDDRTMAALAGALFEWRYDSLRVWVPGSRGPDDPASLGQGWQVLDRGPLPAGSPYVMVTSPSQLFVYGFSTPEDTVQNVGYVYTPATGEWSEIPVSPLDSTQALGGAWTGSEFVLWSTSGVAFWDPANDQWRTGAVPPRALDRYPYWGGDGGWTGSSIVFWANALEYDITRDTWEVIPPPPAYPSRASSTFNGDELVVVGLASEQIPRATAEMAFDPGDDTWRTLPQSGLDGQALDLATLSPPAGSQRESPSSLLGVDYQNHAAIYDAQSNTWTALDPLPLDTGEDSRTVVALEGGRAFVTSTWTGHALLEADGRWTDVPDGPGGFRAAATQGMVFIIGEQFAVYVP